MDKEQLSKLLTFGLQRGASDIHFAVGHRPHYRIKGELVVGTNDALTPDDAVNIARVLLDDSDWDPNLLIREQYFSYSIAGIGRFRGQLFSQRGSVGIVIRVIPYKVKSIEALRLPPVLAEISNTRKGLILVTGANGMGKSTTIAAIIREINENRSAHVVTLEDPIEFLFGGGKSIISQREVGNDTPSYRDGLIAALRQDPDVIMVGDISEPQTAETCLKAAETGHLVIAAISTADVKQTIERWIDMFPTNMQDSIQVRFADCLNAIISLRLLANKAGMGQIPVVEILRGTRAVREYIRKGPMFDEIEKAMEQGRDLYGMQTFDQHLIELCKQDQIKIEVAKSTCSDREMFDKLLGEMDRQPD